MPKLWTDTVASHRTEVRDAILDATATLVAERGITAVSMSVVAERSGITRATLYKYFPDLRSILSAWHERQVSKNLAALTAARDVDGDANTSLEQMLQTYAQLVYEQHSSQLVALLHDSEHASRGYAELTAMLRDAIAEGAKNGSIRRDLSPTDLARYCVHALAAANGVASLAIVRKLVGVTLAGLRRVSPPPKR